MSLFATEAYNDTPRDIHLVHHAMDTSWIKTELCGVPVERNSHSPLEPGDVLEEINADHEEAYDDFNRYNPLEADHSMTAVVVENMQMSDFHIPAWKLEQA